MKIALRCRANFGAVGNNKPPPKTRPMGSSQSPYIMRVIQDGIRVADLTEIKSATLLETR